MNRYEDEVAHLTMRKDAKEKIRAMYGAVERKRAMKKKAIAAVSSLAACAALVVGVLYGGAHTGKNVNETAKNNHFTMTVQAEELKQGEAVPLMIDGTAKAWGIGGNEDAGTVNINIPLPITCKGSHIESITYSVNKGAFQVVEPIEEPIAAGENVNEKYAGVGAVSTWGDFEWEKFGREVAEAHYFETFTIPYDKQDSRKIQINLCNLFDASEVSYAEMSDAFFGNGSPDEKDAEVLQKEYALFQKLLDGTVVTCTVNFADGTTDSAEVAVAAKMLPTEDFENYSIAMVGDDDEVVDVGVINKSTPSSADDAQDFTPDEVPDDGSWDMFITFERI